MQQPVFITANLIYWTIIAITILITTATLGRLWRRHENYRWTTGYVIVFFPGVILVYLGHWDLNTWAGLFFAVGISGAIKVGYERLINSLEAERIRKGENPYAPASTERSPEGK